MNIPDLNLFMMCTVLNRTAVRELPVGFYIRHCRKSELDIWKAIHFDDPETAENYRSFMTKYYNEVYLPEGDLFFNTCLMVCDEADQPVGTCFIWRAYRRISTLHWFKVAKPYEGLGIGRALLSKVMIDLSEDQYPVFLHTQPSSFRAIKLYTDFGFQLLSDPVIGYRKNDLEAALPILEQQMPMEAYAALQAVKAPQQFLDAVLTSPINQF